MTGTYIQMVTALIFVILLILAAGFFLRKRQNRIGLMNIISYQSIGPKKGVAALKVGKEILLLGVTANDMRLLRTFKENELDLTQLERFQTKLDEMRAKGVTRT